MAFIPTARFGGGFLLAATVASAIALSGCGSGAPSGAPAATATPVAAPDDSSGGASQSSVAPNTFLTFEYRRYRLVGIEQANLVDGGAFAKAGKATEADIDAADLTVYRRSGDAGAVFTYSAVSQPGAEAATFEGEDSSVPALWYRWLPEP